MTECSKNVISYIPRVFERWNYNSYTDCLTLWFSKTHLLQFLYLSHRQCSRTVLLTYLVPNYFTHAASELSMSHESLTHSYYSKETEWLSLYNDCLTVFTFEKSWFDCREGRGIYRLFKT